jgi:hypothetical protein
MLRPMEASPIKICLGQEESREGHPSNRRRQPHSKDAYTQGW